MRELNEQEKIWQGDLVDQNIECPVGQSFVAAGLALIANLAAVDALYRDTLLVRLS